MPPYFSVKEAVFPFIKFPGVDTILGPEMKSTGEVMGVGETFGEAFVKSQLAAGVRLPDGGRAFLSVRDARQAAAVQVARDLVELGFALVATRGTAAVLGRTASPVDRVNKVAEGRPHIVDMIKNDEISFIVNTVEEKRAAIGGLALDPHHGARAARHLLHHRRRRRPRALGMKHMRELEPYRLQELHARLRQGTPEPVPT